VKIIKTCNCKTNLLDEIKELKKGISPTADQIVTVKSIIEDVKTNGDSALVHYAGKFDNLTILPENFKVNPKEIESAYSCVSPGLIRAIQNAKRNIENFQNHIKLGNPGTFDVNGNASIVTNYKPIESVGAYIPGGSASYPSTVLMNAVPARVAGVKKIVMVSPPGKDGTIPAERLVAANEAGVDEVYNIGGAQAIAALAFGTESIPAVDKIVGPGNIYVTIAKKEVFGHVGIDILAGPSEVLIIADKNSNPEFIAYDLISQAEHDPGISILVTSSAELVKSVQIELENIVKHAERSDAIKKCLDRFGVIIETQNDDEIAMITNEIGPEHLEVMLEQPGDMLKRINNAGAIFVGDYTPVALGDYIAGPSHVLPTAGTARFFSGLSVNDFLKRSATITYTKQGLKEVADDTIEIARSEGLFAHADSVKIRLA